MLLLLLGDFLLAYFEVFGVGYDLRILRWGEKEGRRNREGGIPVWV